MLALLLGMYGVFVGILQAELRFANNNDVTWMQNVLKVSVSVTTLVLCILVVKIHRNGLKFQKLRGSVDPMETLRSTGDLWAMLLELLICLPHPLPGVDTTVEFNDRMLDSTLQPTYSLDSLFTVWMMLRLYLAVRVFDDAVGLRSNSARVIANWNKIEFNSSFSFKMIMDQYVIFLGMGCTPLSGS